MKKGDIVYIILEIPSCDKDDKHLCVNHYEIVKSSIVDIFHNDTTGFEVQCRLPSGNDATYSTFTDNIDTNNVNDVCFTNLEEAKQELHNKKSNEIKRLEKAKEFYTNAYAVYMTATVYQNIKDKFEVFN